LRHESEDRRIDLLDEEQIIDAFFHTHETMSFPVPLPFVAHHAVLLEECLTYDAPPSLSMSTGTPLGKSPSGTMDVNLSRTVFPGAWRTKTIEIKYDIPSGTQLSYHENPGSSYSGTTRTAYLPNNKDGRKLLARLKHAWAHGLVFTIGTSQTTGQNDAITWSSIPHKTSLQGGEFGWPDENYFSVCNAVLDSLQVPSDLQACTTSRPQQPLSIHRHTVRDERLFYTAPVSLATSNALRGTLQHPSCTLATGDCCICFDPLSQHRFVHIQGCDHAFHFTCINDYLNHELKCPICRHPIGDPQGKSPSGSMSINLSNNDCPGFPNSKAIEIVYDIPPGIQCSYHENPGSRYEGTSRMAFLPDTDEGRRLLTRLKYAWTHGLTFRVGTSLTTGTHNVVTWTSIHHKTSLRGGSHGFPDDNFISNCNGSLDALHVPDADAC